MSRRPTTSQAGAVRYRVRPPGGAAVPVPELDRWQRSVVEHDGGPLLVLAGPGTGKTTTLVEAIVDRVERRGVPPEQVLALTFSRKAAEQLRDQVTARLGGTVATAISSTFHSFAYGLVRQYAPDDLYQAPLHLLSAPEQDVVLAELLTDHPEAVRWPESMRQALGTRGFAREVGQVLARAREKGLSPEGLHRLGVQEAVPEYAAAGVFWEQYLDILDSQGAIDYSDLIRRAVIEAEAHRDQLRRRFSEVFVDEYQDTDPGQVALLQAIAGDGGDLTVVGDPHQSIYGFRGADVRGILQFPTEFPRRGGDPAPVVALRHTRRFGPRLLRASGRVAARLGLTGTIDAGAREAFLDPVARADGPHGEGRVEVHTFDTERAEAEHLADLLRRAHLEDGVPWSEMAVLVRSGRATIPALRRSLTAAGVPVEVAADDTPLVREPAVRPLLDALAAVLGLEEDDPAAVGYVDPGRATSLLLSPLGGLDAAEVRALSRALRSRELDHAAREERSPRSSEELVREAVVDPEVLAGIRAPGAERVRRLARLLRAAHRRLAERASAEEVLWELWDGTDWPHRLRASAESGGTAARLAHRDLDAVVALFDNAARVEEQRGHTSVRNFLDGLEGQQIPADTLAERGVRGDAVRLLTAHRSKGLQWRLVVVAHVQEEGWPDLRRRGSLLRPDRIGGRAGVPELQPLLSVREALAEERRLFYVACTRARERLVVTAVRSPEDDGEQPSRFLAELRPDQDLAQVPHTTGRPTRPLSLPGLVAELRRTVADPEAEPALRDAAARRLARLAAERTPDGRALVPTADPGTWWGTRAPSRSEAPLRPADEPLTLSASVLTSLLACPARWFLEREAGGATPATASQGFGLVVHAVADRMARGELPADPERVEEVMEHVDRVWGQIAFRTPWSGEREREEVRQALHRFVQWQSGEDARRLLATEHRLTCEVDLPDGPRVRLHGYADRVEIDAEGRVVVVDLKTGKYPPTGDEVAAHPQLGLYQYAVAHGAVDDLVIGEEGAPAGREPGGAELVHLRTDKPAAKVQAQSPPRRGEDGELLVEQQLARAVGLLREERFPAVSGKHCETCGFQALCPIKGAGTVLS